MYGRNYWPGAVKIFFLSLKSTSSVLIWFFLQLTIYIVSNTVYAVSFFFVSSSLTCLRSLHSQLLRPRPKACWSYLETSQFVTSYISCIICKHNTWLPVCNNAGTEGDCERSTWKSIKHHRVFGAEQAWVSGMTFSITLEFDKHLGSSAVDMSV